MNALADFLIGLAREMEDFLRGPRGLWAHAIWEQYDASLQRDSGSRRQVRVEVQNISRRTVIIRDAGTLHAGFPLARHRGRAGHQPVEPRETPLFLKLAPDEYDEFVLTPLDHDELGWKPPNGVWRRLGASRRTVWVSLAKQPRDL